MRSPNKNVEVMDAPPAMQQKQGAKVWDLAYGSLLIGGAPLAAAWVLGALLGLPSSFMFRHYGERIAFGYQLVTGGVAAFAALVAFGLAIWWRTRHRVLAPSMLVLEIPLAIGWAGFLVLYLALLHGPTDL